jgi:hypothetical protein
MPKRIFAVLALAIAPLGVAAQTFKAESVEASDGQANCVWARDRLITVVSGPCDDFKPPKAVRLGETFCANGKTKTIKVVIAYRAERDYPGKRAGDWDCVAAESASDIPGLSGKSSHTGTWLHIPKCAPVK